MENAQKIEKTAKSQTGKDISDVPNPMYQMQLIRQTKHKLPNIFLIQNKGKGPPGRQRSPGAVICRNPEHPPDEQTEPRFLNDKKSGYLSVLKKLNSEDLPAQVRIRRKTELHVDFQPNFKIYKRTQITNFYHNLIFTIMKKQILILTFFVLAIFAGTKSYAQPFAKVGTAPQTISCTPDALHPTAGIPYTYTLDGTPGGGTWNWYATKNTTFITGAAIPNDSIKESPTGVVAASANYGKDGASNQVTITWSEAILSATSYQGSVAPGTPTFVVGYYKATNPNCADNIKIYELDPKPSFTVDVLSLNPTTFLPDATTYTYAPAQCVDVVQSATYNAAKKILYDFGTNYLYYEFVAANFTDYWVPTFALTGLDASQTLTYEYTYANPTTWGTTAPTWTALASGTTQLKVDPTVTSTAAGVSVYVRVTVKNNEFETLANQTAVMNLDGQNKIGTWDVINSTCTPTNAADQNDKSTQTITLRPTVIEGTTSTQAPNLKLIPKN